MTGDKIEKVLDIRVNYDKALTQLGTYRNTLSEIKQAESLITAEYNKGRITREQYNKQMSALDQNTRIVKDSQKQLTKEVQNGLKIDREKQGSLSQMRVRLSQLTKEYDSLGRSERNAMRGATLRSEINNITKELKDAEMATQRFYRNVGNYRSAIAGLKQMGSAFRTLGSIISNTLGPIMGPAFVTSMMDVAKNFEDAMGRVRAVSNPMMHEFDMLRDKAMQLGRDTRYTASEVAIAMEELARKGFSAEQTEKSIEPVLHLAQANSVSLSEAAQVASSSLRAFQFDVNEMGRVVDVLSSACANSATNINMLGEAMKVAGPTAQSANVDLETTVSLLGSLANVGMTGSDAGTGVKQLMMALTTAARGTDKQRAILEKYNLTINETRIRSGELLDILQEMKKSGIGKSLADLKDLSGKYASPRLANIINSIDRVNELKKKLDDSIGENDRMFAQSLGKTSTALYSLRSAWESTMIEMYESTESYIVEPINFLKEIIKGVGEQIHFVGQQFLAFSAAFMAAPLWKGISMVAGNIVSNYKNIVTTSKAASTRIIEQERVALENFTQAEHAKTVVYAEHSKIRAQYKAVLDRENDAKMKLDALKRAQATQKEISEQQMKWNKMVQIRMRAEQQMAVIGRQAQLANIAMQEAETAKIAAIREAAAVKSMGTLAMWKTKIGAFFSSIRSMMASFVPFLVVLGIVEAIQGVSRMRELLNDVEHAGERVNEKVNNTVGEDAKIKKLNQMKLLMGEIFKSQGRTNKLTKDEAEAVASVAKRLKLKDDKVKAITTNLRVEKEVQKEINKAIEDQIDAQEKLAKKQALFGIQQEAMTNIQKLGMKYGIQSTDPKAIRDKMVEIMNSEGVLDSALSKIGAFLGWNTVYTNAKQAEAYYKTYVDSMAKLKLAGGLPEALKSTTEEGSYNPAKPDDGKDNGRSSAQNALDKLIDQIASTRVSNTNETYDKKREKILEDVLKILREWNKQVGNKRVSNALSKTNIDFIPDGGGASTMTLIKEWLKKYQLKEFDKGTLEKAFKENPDVAKAIEEKLPELIIELSKNLKINLDSITLDELISDKSIFIEGLQGIIANMETIGEEYYNRQIKLLEAQKSKALSELDKQFYAERFGKTSKQGTMDDRQEGFDEYTKKRNGLDKKYTNGDIDDIAYQEQLSALNRVYSAEAELYARRLTLMEKFNIDKKNLEIKSAEESAKIIHQRLANELSQTQTGYAELINQRLDHQNYLKGVDESYWTSLKDIIGTQAGEELQLRYKIAQQELQVEKDKGRQRNETEEDYQARIREREAALVAVHTDANEAIITSDEGRWQAYHSVADGIMSLMDAMGEKSTGMAKLAKVLALANIAISTGEAIANTVREASKVMWPANVPVIAGGIATVLSNIATAISTVNSAKFARGKVNIAGAGTTTSDSIPAQISKGESVMNAKATQMFEPLLIAMNAIGNGVTLPRNTRVVQPDQMAELRDALITANQEIRPVVDVREITRQQHRVEVIQNLDSF